MSARSHLFALSCAVFGAACASRPEPPARPKECEPSARSAVAAEPAPGPRTARALAEETLASLERTHPPEHPDVQRARQSLGEILAAEGDLEGARALLERVLEARSRALPDDHPDLNRSRAALAGVIGEQGDLQGERALLEKVLEVRTRALPDGHPDLAAASLALARSRERLGDLAGARALAEKALEVFSKTLPPDAAELQDARLALGRVVVALGDLQLARQLQSQAVETLARIVPPDHPRLLDARDDLADTLRQLGDLRSARALLEAAVSAMERRYPPDHPRLLRARLALAETKKLLGDAAGARRELKATLAVLERTLPAEHPDFERARIALLTLAPAGASDPASNELALAVARDGRQALAAQVLRASPREAEARAGATERALEATLTRASPADPRFAAEAFALAKTMRSARASAALLQQAGDRDPLPRPDVDVASVSAQLPADEALVAYRAFRRTTQTGEAPVPTEDRIGAFVVRSGERIDWIELGELQPIAEALERWRIALGVDRKSTPTGAGSLLEEGARVRELVLDPLEPKLAGATRIAVVLDDVLHLIPFDALPARSGDTLGDAREIATLFSCRDLLAAAEPAADGPIVLFGGADFGTGSGTASFAPLPGTEREVLGIAELAREHGRAVEVRTGKEATTEALRALAPKARVLHLATHAWFDPESVRSWSDPAPRDARAGTGLRASGVELVRGLSPLLLTRLALANANVGEDSSGKVHGILTGEGLATFDLGRAELVVLSGASTASGLCRRGQGVASLQSAAHTAGARAVLASLWAVSDEASSAFLLAFHRALLVEGFTPLRAVRNAKRALRDARDTDGAPLHSTRDWAGWVLAGTPPR